MLGFSMCQNISICGRASIIRNFENVNTISHTPNSMHQLRHISGKRMNGNPPPSYFSNLHDKPMTIHELNNGTQQKQYNNNSSNGQANQLTHHYQLTQHPTFNRHTSGHLNPQIHQHNTQGNNSGSPNGSNIKERLFSVIIGIALLGSISSFIGLYLLGNELEIERAQSKKYLEVIQQVNQKHVQTMKRMKLAEEVTSSNVFANYNLTAFHIALLEQKLIENKIETVSNEELLKLAQENFDIVRHNGKETLNIKPTSNYARLVPNSVIYSLYRKRIMTYLVEKENEERKR